VVISGRTGEAVVQAIDKLTTSFTRDRIFGVPCDIRQPAQAKSLWDLAVTRFGSVDIWINNAGVANPVSEVWQVSYDDIQNIVDTNIKGTYICTQIAIQEMLSQGFGAIYNLEGLGSEKGRIVPGMSLYGMTKAGLRFFDDTLFKELDGKPVIAGALQPGMVVTGLIGEQNSGNQEQFERVKWITNIIGNRVEDVAPWLVAKMLENTRNGVRFRFMGTMKTTLRFLIAPFRKRDLFSDHS
jgi:NADP-dependent 3-hydroxy acid dehydrogenase YdfG